MNSRMKRIFFIMLVLLCGVCLSVNAQEKGAGKSGGMLLSMDYVFAGEGYTNLNNSDFATNDFSIKLGYRFNNIVSVYIPVVAAVAKENLASTRNYTDQSLLGLGAEYAFNVRKVPFILDLSLASTIVPNEQKYLSGAFMIKVAGSSCATSPMVGLGVIYNKPYDNSGARLLLGFSFGCRIF